MLDSNTHVHAAFRYVMRAKTRRLVAALCRMRGAAFKLGRMLSIQDEDMLSW